MDAPTTPPRLFGALLAVLGLALAVGGTTLGLSAGLYFIVAGAGVVLSGVLIALGKALGAWLYLATFVAMAVWSFVEVGADVNQLLPRLLLPALLCGYIYSSRVRPRLG